MLLSSARLPIGAAISSGCRLLSSAPPLVLTEEKEEGVLLLTLNRPEKLNAMNLAIGDEFHSIMRGMSDGSLFPDARAVVITGAGRGFSAGGDMNFLKERTQAPPESNIPAMLAFYRQWLSVMDSPVPVVAAINGPAVGAGACFALACDLRVMARSASIGFNFTRLGMHPGMGSTHLLAATVGEQAAAEMLLTGKIFGAEEARARGLVAGVEETTAACVAAALGLAAEAGAGNRLAVRLTTATLRAARRDGLDSALERESIAQALNYGNGDMDEGVDRVLAGGGS